MVPLQFECGEFDLAETSVLLRTLQRPLGDFELLRLLEDVLRFDGSISQQLDEELPGFIPGALSRLILLRREQVVRGHPAVLTVEEGQISNGFGAFMAREINDLDVARIPRIASMGMPDEFIEHGARDDLLAAIALDVDGIAARAKELVASASHSTVGA